jgi:hypothetical protein
MGYLISYKLGYQEESYAPLIYPVILELLAIIVFLALLTTWMYSLYRQKYRWWMTGIMAGIMAIAGVEMILPSHGLMIAYGLRDRLAHDYELGDLRRFAREIDNIPRLSGEGVEDTWVFDRKRLAENGLNVKYTFLNWVKGPSSEGPTFVNERDGTVNVRWGGPLEGHWGFSVNVKGEKLNVPSSPGTTFLPMSDDICVVSESE